MNAAVVIDALQAHARSDEDAAILERFFKTGVGEYGEGDVFIGVRVPDVRAVCKQFKDLPLTQVQKLLDSKVHEHRLAAVILLSNAYQKASVDERQKIFDMYLKNVYANRVNNWDLIDSSAHFIVGEHLRDRPRDLLFSLAKSDNLWQRRVAIISTFAFIKQGDPSTTLAIAEVLLYDRHDLIQKAVGWMLREMGKRVGEQLLVSFLEQHYKTMPRTMLRYAIERLTPEQRALLMKR
jgi:3-methyladenine DNA glycosylase AlkD